MRPILHGQHSVAYAESGIQFQILLNQTVALIGPNNPAPRCFISYARPADARELTQLQDWIRFLATSLRQLNITVEWDERIQGAPGEWMQDGIHNSQWVILIGTPLYKQRANIPGTGVCTEMQEISRRVQAGTLTVLPLLYDGTWENAIPEVIQNRAFSIDACHPDFDYRIIMSPVGPVGIVPRIYQNLQGDDQYNFRWRIFSLGRRNCYHSAGVVPAEDPQPARVAAQQPVPVNPQPQNNPERSLYFGGAGGGLFGAATWGNSWLLTTPVGIALFVGIAYAHHRLTRPRP